MLKWPARLRPIKSVRLPHHGTLLPMIISAAPSAGTSFEVLVTLVAVLVGSSATFWVLVRRWESHRQWHALSDWAGERKFRSRSVERHGLPPTLAALSDHAPVVRLFFANAETTIVQFQTPPRQLRGQATLSASPSIWNLLIRRFESAWHPTALRPSEAASSVIDLFSLAGFPLLGPTGRFTVFGTDSTHARALSDSMARSLLPPDVGLLLRQNELILDFSERPFDAIELDRMLALANQIAEKLPAASTV